MKKILFLLPTLLMTACPVDIAHQIYIENKSDKSIYFHLSTEYPNTTIPASSNNHLHYLRLLKPNEVHFVNSLPEWEEIFTSYFPKDTLIIFFFDADTIKKYDWEVIRAEHKVMEQRIYSKYDLQSNGWTITYTGER